jgi:hypothetical protein
VIALSKHTPGKWSVSNGALLRVTTTTTKRPLVICGVHRLGRFGGKAVGDPLANAHLIAAAPDLLAALKEAVEWHGDEENDDIARWRAAIAAAEGDAS